MGLWDAGRRVLGGWLLLVVVFSADPLFAERVFIERSFCGEPVNGSSVRIVIDDEVLDKSDIDFAEPESIHDHCCLKITARFKAREGAFRTEFYYVNPQGEPAQIRTRSEYPRTYDEMDMAVIWISRASSPWNLAKVHWDQSANRWRQ